MASAALLVRAARRHENANARAKKSQILNLNFGKLCEREFLSEWGSARHSEGDFTQGLRLAVEERASSMRSSGTGGTGSDEDLGAVSEGENSDPPAPRRFSGLSAKRRDREGRFLRRSGSGLLDGYQGSGQKSTLCAMCRSRLPIDPNHPWKVRWDMLVGAFIVYTVVWLPFKICFSVETGASWSVFDRLVDIAFSLDVVLCFMTGYYTAQGKYVSDGWSIARRYLYTFFVPDVVSCVPIELVVLISRADNMNSIKLMKFVRLVRLMKLMRLLKIQKFLLDKLNMSPALIRLVKLLGLIIVLVHLFACVWYLAGYLNTCQDEPCPEDALPTWIDSFGIAELNLRDRYISSFHLVMATMMAVGYGDIYATNTLERAVSLCMQFVGATTFGLILSAVTNLLDSGNPRDAEYKKQMSEIKEWMRGRQLPVNLRREIRRHFEYAFSKKSIFPDEGDLLGNMPANLRAEIVERSSGKMMTALDRRFGREEFALRAELMVQLRPQRVFEHEDVLEAGEISSDVYFVVSGRLEILVEADAAKVQRKDWARRCIRLTDNKCKVKTTSEHMFRRSLILNLAGSSRRGKSLIDEAAEEEQREDLEILCGIYTKGDVFGLFAACPTNVRGQQARCEVLSCSRDTLLGILLRFPGAIEAHNALENKEMQEMDKVLASSILPETVLGRRCKKLVFFEGKAQPATKIPQVMIGSPAEPQYAWPSGANESEEDVAPMTPVSPNSDMVDEDMERWEPESEQAANADVDDGSSPAPPDPPLEPLPRRTSKPTLPATEPTDLVPGTVKDEDDEESQPPLETASEESRRLTATSVASNDYDMPTTPGAGKAGTGAATSRLDGDSPETVAEEKSSPGGNNESGDDAEIRAVGALPVRSDSTVSMRMSGADRRREDLLRTVRLTAAGETEECEETESMLLARFIIPPFHKDKFRWDMVIGVLIMYSVLMIPFQIGFEIKVEWWSFMFFFEVLVDTLFVSDIVLNFRTAFSDSEGLLNTVPRDIRARYCRAWFWIDLVSVLPVDRICDIFLPSDSNASTQTRTVRLVRIVRLARLLKLVRLLRMGRLVEALEETLELSAICVMCWKLLFKLLILSHLLGCFWFYCSQPLEASDACDTGLLKGCRGKRTTRYWETIGLEKDDTLHQYIASVYWSFTTMTTVGYGEIHPQNYAERLYAIIVMLFGAIIFGYIIGSIAALASQERGIEGLSKKRMSVIKDYCEESGMTNKRLEQVKLHFQFVHSQRPPISEDAILMQLPSALRKLAVMHIHRDLISRIGLFSEAVPQGQETLGTDANRRLPSWFVAWTVTLLEPIAIGPGDEILHNDGQSPQCKEIFFVYEGTCKAYICSEAEQPHADTGGSTQVSDVPSDIPISPSSASESAGGRWGKAVLTFKPGHIFGLEFMYEWGKCRYKVVCSNEWPCFLFVLRQAAFTELAASSPEMAIALRVAVSNCLMAQMDMVSR